ncbi:MAG: hypothetical protein ACK5MP_10445 [Nostocoides sp.]
MTGDVAEQMAEAERGTRVNAYLLVLLTGAVTLAAWFLVTFDLWPDSANVALSRISLVLLVAAVVAAWWGISAVVVPLGLSLSGLLFAWLWPVALAYAAFATVSAVTLVLVGARPSRRAWAWPSAIVLAIACVWTWALAL